MGTFAETAIVDYHLSFADQGKQTFIFGFHLQQTNINCRFPLVSFSIYIYAAILNGKWKTKAQTIFLDPFTICSLCKRKIVVCPVVDEEKNGNYPFAYGLNGLTD
jgi:hypothetical protein